MSGGKTSGSVILELPGGCRLKLSSPFPDVWRLQTASAEAAFDDQGAVQELSNLCDDIRHGEVPLSVSESGSVARIEGGGASVQVDRNTGSVEFASRIKLNVRCSDEAWHLHVPLSGTERVLGTGERFNGVDQRGYVLEMWAEDKWCAEGNESYIPIPFAMTLSGVGLLLNRYEKSVFDIGSEDADIMKLTQHDAPLDLYVILKSNPADVLKTLPSLWGAPAPVPEWGFGVMVSRHLHSKELGTVEGIREMVEAMHRHDLPWTVAVIEGWDTYDSETYDDLREIVGALRGDGKKMLIYDTCGRLGREYWEKQQAKKEYFVRNRQGGVDIAETEHENVADAADRKTSTFLDLTDEAAVEWWREQVWKRLTDMGIDGSKVDFCEQFPEHDDMVLSGRDSIQGMHHFYPVKYNIMMKEIFDSARKESGLLWSRGGGIGVHKYPMVWCGDQRREFSYLQTMLTAILSSGLSGIPFMGHDLGGYSPAWNDDSEVEVFLRGTQMACFTASMETHGKVARPYDFPEEVVDIYRLYSRIRYALIPYLKEQAAVSVGTGLPLVRHMCLQHPEDKVLSACDDQFFLGEDLLVVPVLDTGDRRTVLLPPGTWEGLFDGQTVHGSGDPVEVVAPINTIPVFVANQPGSKVLNHVVEEIRQIFKRGVVENEIKICKSEIPVCV